MLRPAPRRLSALLSARALAFAILLLGPWPGLAGGLAAQEPSDESPAAGKANRLADETSPYLLMHAHNPVNWYPWGEEALARARQENKPIFLSIGYSSCHWCHVMERESFLDPEIAAFLNEHFVCIKVDREERPDIDSIYMTALHVFNRVTGNGRGGGWPLTMFMTPEGKPFFGGTYFPARDGDRQGMPGFLTLSQRVSQAWNERRDFVNRDADRLAELTRAELGGRRDRPASPIRAEWSEDCLRELGQTFDPVHGGFGFSEGNPRIPKFPQASNLFFLLEFCRQSPENESAKKMLQVTLDQMFQGGIYDHVGGGFHRYSVDRFWHIPHFEKMLYDNGQLLAVYARASTVFPDAEYRQVCDEIVAFVLREMTDGQGGFYSALDAESEGEEGKYYRWEESGLRAALTDDEFSQYAAVYGIDGSPNFEEKYYAPQLARSLREIASGNGQAVAELSQELEAINQKLLAVRNRRVRPLLDTKILTSWNGLMIRGLADAGRIFEKPEYVAAAARAADFLWDHSRVDGRLKRTHTAGQARLNAYVDDYAFLIDGLLGLHLADGDRKWLDRARELQDQQDELFWDEQAGGYFFTSSDHESLLARAKKPGDNAIPSGNSMAVNNLVYLAGALQEEKYLQQARRTLEGSGSLISDYSTIAPRMLVPLYKILAQDPAPPGAAPTPDGP